MLCALGLLSQGRLLAQNLPEHDGLEHLGVKSCSASTCHGSITERNAYPVLQNEYQTWTRHDKHSRAYEVLLNERSQRIARNLGIEKAHEADICLDCHADNVPAAQRGRFFNLSDGVGCEACHGGAEQWLGPHISASATHAGNIEAGMYPTEEPQARAKLCLSCHLGTDKKYATHRIMGAGHPRLSFELVTFTALQPAHYRIDADYRERKSVAAPAQEWLDGLLVSGQQSLAMIRKHYQQGEGLPELALFDCHACHHSLDDLRWQASAFSGETEPGMPRLEDSRLRMIALLESGVLGSESVAGALRALHDASLKGAQPLMAATGQLENSLAAAATRLRERAGASEALSRAIFAAAAGRQFQDYADAEQAAMAAQALVAGQADEAALEAVFAALQNADTYQPQQAAAALAALGGLQVEQQGSGGPAGDLGARRGGGALAVVSVTSLRMRAGPGLDQAVLGSLGAGTRLRVLENREGWSRVETLDASTGGWVASRLIKPVSR